MPPPRSANGVLPATCFGREQTTLLAKFGGREGLLGFDVGEAGDDEELVELEDGEVRLARQSITSGSHNARQRSREARAEVISRLPEQGL